MKQVIRNHQGKGAVEGEDPTKKVPGGTLKSRSVPPNVIDQWRQKVNDMADTIEEIYDEEKMEKMLRVANMEANKAANMVNYSDDISARPARTWFQSEDMKKALKETSRDAKSKHMEDQATKMEEQKNKRVHRLSRKKRRRIEMLAEMEEDRREAEAEGDMKAASRSNLESIEAKTLLKVRSAKKQAQAPGLSRESGNAPEETKKKKKNKAEQKAAESDGGGEPRHTEMSMKKAIAEAVRSTQAKTASAFGADMYASGGGRSKPKGVRGPREAPESDPKEAGAKPKKSKVQTGGFKSKSRYKRR